MTTLRAGFFVLFLAVTAYANSLGNGFAYDDYRIVTQNPVVINGDWVGALSATWWPDPEEGTGLYRPLTSASFAVEWRLFKGSPLGFHAVNVMAHGLVALLLFFLLLELGSLPGALAGAGLFAIHPLHTEAVANVVGRAELYSAVFYLTACLLYWRGRGWEGWPRVFRLLALGSLYFLSLASKEIGVTLPGAFFLLELLGPRGEKNGPSSLLGRVSREGTTYVLLAAVLAAYLGLRLQILGTVSGEHVAPIFQLVGPWARVLTAIAIWVQYLRLHLFPLDLSSDYDPGVLFPSEGLDGGVVLGALVLAGLGYAALRCWRTVPLVSLGILWFGVAVLPVSNLLFSTGVLLAERTLYLPSMGLALVVAGLVKPALSLRLPIRKAVLPLALLAGLALFVRTVVRNPAWLSSYQVHETLNREHPESWRSFRSRAEGMEGVGEIAGAARAWDQAVLLAPMNYTLLVQAGDFHARAGDWGRGQMYLQAAVELAPQFVNAYQILSGHFLRRGLGREGHRAALDGLARAGPDPELWALVSESYLLKGDLPAAVRARKASIGLGPDDADQWRRLGEILEAMGDEVGAADARGRAEVISTLENQARSGSRAPGERGAP